MTKMQDGKMSMTMKVMLLAENLQDMIINLNVIIIIIVHEAVKNPVSMGNNLS